LDYQSSFDDTFDGVVAASWLPSSAVAAALRRLCTPAYQPREDGAILRSFFHQRGVSVLGKQIEFFEGSAE